jgi:hypothetical protein
MASSGGLANEGTATLTGVTLSGNTATYTTRGSGGCFAVGGGLVNGDTASLKNTIVAKQLAGLDCDGTITSLDRNPSSDASCGFAALGDLSSTDPLLGPLADNGGPTRTHALLPGSPGINAGTNIGCPPLHRTARDRPAAGPHLRHRGV